MKFILLIFISTFFITGCTNIPNAPVKTQEVQAEEIKKEAIEETPKKFLIYFLIDSVHIQKQSDEILVNALLAAKKSNIKSIEIVGHSDKSGNKAYNEKLSLQRAESIAGFFVANGINKSKMKVYSLGESQPLVETKDGEVNDQNRRVEIILD